MIRHVKESVREQRRQKRHPAAPVRRRDGATLAAELEAISASAQAAADALAFDEATTRTLFQPRRDRGKH